MADEGFKRKLAAILSAGAKGLIGNSRKATVRIHIAYRAAIKNFALKSLRSSSILR